MPEPEPDPVIGQELRDFFLDLLDDAFLREYHGGRHDYIDKRRRAPNNGHQLSDESERLLREGTLGEIEAHIMAVEGSGRAVPFFVISPP